MVIEYVWSLQQKIGVLGGCGQLWYLNDHSLILVGDLNLVLLVDESQGAHKVIDPLASFFKEIFEGAGLIVVSPNVIIPTWSNGRMGKASVANKLDHFLMAESLGNVYWHIQVLG